MDSKLLKRRVIGAAVLVALGVIFIPMILSGGRDEMPLFGSNIPGQPKAIRDLKSLEIPMPQEIPPSEEEVRIPVDERLPPAKHDPVKSASQPSDNTNSEQSASAAAPAASATAKGWVVQVGSFSRRANALALQKKLRRYQFPAFVEQVSNKHGAVYRVRVGPETQRSDAQAQLQAIQKKLKIRGVVMSHP